MGFDGMKAMGTNPQWEQTRSERRGDHGRVGEAIAEDFKGLGADQVYTVKAGDTFWDISEAVKLSNKDYASFDTGGLAAEIQKNTGVNDPTKLQIGTRVDLDKYLPDAAPQPPKGEAPKPADPADPEPETPKPETPSGETHPEGGNIYFTYNDFRNSTFNDSQINIGSGDEEPDFQIPEKDLRPEDCERPPVLEEPEEPTCEPEPKEPTCGPEHEPKPKPKEPTCGPEHEPKPKPKEPTCGPEHEPKPKPEERCPEESHEDATPVGLYSSEHKVALEREKAFGLKTPSTTPKVLDEMPDFEAADAETEHEPSEHETPHSSNIGTTFANFGLNTKVTSDESMTTKASEFMKAKDANKDGKLSASEVNDFEGYIEALDMNGDEQVGLMELSSLYAMKLEPSMTRAILAQQKDSPNLTAEQRTELDTATEILSEHQSGTHSAHQVTEEKNEAVKQLIEECPWLSRLAMSTVYKKLDAETV